MKNRAHTDPGTLIQSMREANTGQPYLADVSTVDAILRQFSSDVVARYAEVSKGSLAQQDAVSEDRAGCFKIADIMLGKDPKYSTLFGWNVENVRGNIAFFIRNELKQQVATNEDDRSVVAQAVALMLRRIYGIIAGSKSKDSTVLMDELGKNIVPTRNLFIGLPTYG